MLLLPYFQWLCHKQGVCLYVCMSVPEYTLHLQLQAIELCALLGLKFDGKHNALVSQIEKRILKAVEKNSYRVHTIT